MSMQINEAEVIRIAAAFCDAMVWADAEEGTSPRVPRETQIAAQQYVRAFVDAFPAPSRAALDSREYGWWQGRHNTCNAFGHDLYLTARGHGVGFADRDALGETGEMLNEEIRKGWQRWEVETEQYRGWMYLRDRATAPQQGSDIP